MSAKFVSRSGGGEAAAKMLVEGQLDAGKIPDLAGISAALTPDYQLEPSYSPRPDLERGF